MSTKSYSSDLRERVVKSIEGGMSTRESAQYWQVSRSSALAWFRRKQSTGSIEAKRRGGYKKSILETHESWLLWVVEQEPDITLHELQRRVEEERGRHVYIGALWNFFKRHQISFKKKVIYAQEQAR